jgi:hypothetical protein
MSDLVATRSPLVAGGQIRGIIPRDNEEAFRMASAVCKAGLAPKGMDTPDKCVIAIMLGLEVGLSPMMAVQKIAVINGRPTIWGDAAMGLVRASGLCQSIQEHIEGDGDKQTAICHAHRKGEPRVAVGTFSVADAKRAGLWGKSGPWQQYPQRMLQMRARGFALRDAFADVLGGMYLHEELQGEPEMRDVTLPRRPPPPPGHEQQAVEVIQHLPDVAEPAAEFGHFEAREAGIKARAEGKPGNVPAEIAQLALSEAWLDGWNAESEVAA